MTLFKNVNFIRFQELALYKDMAKLCNSEYSVSKPSNVINLLMIINIIHKEEI